ncbi:HNH endonuclease [Pelagibacterium sp.]|uniref:HNH endonuclease n=1 Tax=Pelagibacterium sp. TaxID=1967288 RepID=UPI003A8CC595
MGFGVFIHRADSIYDDSPATQYQFPSQYYSRVKSCIGDWVVYYEPTKVRNSRGYYAVAKVADVIRDPNTPDMFLALIEPGSYLPFTNPVPFVLDDKLVEAGLLNDLGRISGRAQAAVRSLGSKDFNRIIDMGLVGQDDLLPRSDALASVPPGLEEEQAPFEVERERVRVLTSRILRDRVFRRVVLKAYDSRCGITGLKLINGGGRAEVEAAHIRPVEANGPDIINNGVPLSGTIHWMFDRGLITLEDDLEIVISRQVNDRQGLESLINKSGRLIGPDELRDRPHPEFLLCHRENVFKY